MKRLLRNASWVLCLLLGLGAALGLADEGWRAGVARENITPQQFMWMSGYGSRDAPADGKLTDLWAKALVLEDPAGEQAVLVTLDLVGIGHQVSNAVRDELERRYGLQRSQVALCTSHTHTGPVVGDNLRSMYFYDDEQDRLVRDYTARLSQQLVELVGRALEALEPCRLSQGQGEAKFAVNRRNNPADDVPARRAEGTLVGPFDHDVPVLAVRRADDSLLAIVLGYACHATTLSVNQWSGDYPGYAQIELEAAHPGATALFWAGCGADQNPLPRRTVELAQDYGRQLAQAVGHVLDGEMQAVEGRLQTAYAEIDLPFDKLPTVDQLKAEAASDNRFVASRARRLLDQIEAGGSLSPTYPYPIQVWHLGSELCFITLGGEVVVDYALRLKSELGADTTWVAGYANDVMAYIPSRRVLTEGGYEGGGAMVYYGLPTVWDPSVEERIVRKVHELADR